ncbi:uncharacterized protein LOC134034116 [Osmerus eperlanus]|uniref:uncharacterized protein LOC134034116 n=1 Tax=Osmerus eperlanus TaxID=29151 RepID=UPI002E0E19DE
MMTLIVNLIIKVIDICFVAGNSGVGSFMTFRAIKERERKTFFSKTRQKVQKQKTVKIYVGVMKIIGDSLKPVRGKSLPVDIQPQWSSDQLLAAAVKKQKDFNQDMEGAHVLLYPDAQEIRNIPGTDTPFTVQKYKEAIGKAYQRITMYICTVENFANICSSGQTSSEDDSVVHVNLPSGDSPLSDTVVWDGPDEVSTPRMDNILHGHPKPAADQDGRQTAVQEEVNLDQGQTFVETTQMCMRQ